MDEYHYKSQVELFSYDAYEIHGISEVQMNGYPPKIDALRKLLQWMPVYKQIACFCNTNNFGNYYHFDLAVFRRTFLDIGHYHEYYKHFNESDILNVWKLCKENKKLIFGDETKPSFKQTNIYNSLFNKTYDAHNAKADVHAMIEIVKQLRLLLDANQSIFS